MAIFFALVALLLLCGCQTAIPTPLVTHNDQWVEYHSEPVNGIIGRTADGKTLVTAGYIRWAEHLAIDLEAEKAKTEQERLKNLNPAK